MGVQLQGDIIHLFLSYFFQFYHPTGSAIPACSIPPHAILVSQTLRERYSNLIYPVGSPILPLAFLSRGPSRRGTLPFSRINSAPTLFQIEAISRARRSVFIQTPNLTSRAL